MRPFLSIIIPVYNTASYLSKCINSILEQSFSDFEILLIDDGSTDGSGAICDMYAGSDYRIRVIHKQNGGVSSARNVGLDNVHGEWIYFVDSDDELLPGGLQVLVDGVSDDADNVLGGYERHSSDGEVLEAIQERITTTFSKEESLYLLFPSQPKYYSYLGYMCLWLFRSTIIRENNLRFDSSIKIKEDTLFVTQYLCVSNGRTRFNTAPVYKYKMRDDSAMGGLFENYNPDYLTSFDAVLEMHAAIHQLQHIGKELSEVSKYEVVNRIYLIYGHMSKFNVVDRKTISSMKLKAIKEVGLTYYLKYQYHRIYRRAKNLISRITR